MFCCLQKQGGCFEPDDMDASGFGPPIPTILTFGGQRDVNLTPQQSLSSTLPHHQHQHHQQQQQQHQQQHQLQHQQQATPPLPIPPPPIPASLTGANNAYINSYVPGGGGNPVNQHSSVNTNTNNIINTSNGKEPYSVINPKILTGSIHRPSQPQIEHIHGGWPIGFESAISATVGESPGTCAYLLTIFSVIIIVLFLPLSLFFSIKVVQEYERAVIFRLGRLLPGGAKGPGIFFIIPCIDTYTKVDLRTVSFDVPPQEILSKDSVTVAVDAVVYYRISNAAIAVSNVEDYGRSTRLLAATTLRNVLGTKNLSEILSERESISHVMQTSLDEATDPWGVKVERVEIKDVRLPVQLQRAMATEAEAAREARAKVIAAEGEQRASKALREASEVIHDSPAALQLRYLQTLSSIAAEKNSTIVFPVPMELFRGLIPHHLQDEPEPVKRPKSQAKSPPLGSSEKGTKSNEQQPPPPPQPQQQQQQTELQAHGNSEHENNALFHDVSWPFANLMLPWPMDD
ncbi:mechanosensory protein 2-like [Panonychus citri]|uniref:mechanosensory protein 2-like n=1 Tax=Panonychus citri TaxID=50023 RepID=UPI002307AABE|nr:mechanosensory protein 2-like [Panonychus citri]